MTRQHVMHDGTGQDWAWHDNGKPIKSRFMANLERTRFFLTQNASQTPKNFVSPENSLSCNFR